MLGFGILRENFNLDVSIFRIAVQGAEQTLVGMADDVLSELDKNRRSALLKMALNKSQIFITSTDIDQELLELTHGSFNKYHIEGGNILY